MRAIASRAGARPQVFARRACDVKLVIDGDEGLATAKMKRHTGEHAS